MDRPFDIVEIACFIAWLILLLPVFAFLATTWRIRRDNLFARLDEGHIRLYYKQFFPSTSRRKRKKHEPAQPENLQTRFRRDFGRLYGARHYLLPLGLLALVSGIAMWATARSVQGWLGMNATIKPFPPLAISALLGAYSWVLYDQFRRFRSGDFTPHDVYAYVSRFLIAVPLGISFAAFLKDDVGIGVVFLLAAFPTNTLFKISRRLASQKLGLGENEEGGSLELEKLQSISRSNAERYVDEGITTIAELAWANPIDLSIRTNREFSFVIDSVSQALLWVYFEDRVKEMYPLSLRGAQEVCTLLDELASDEPKTRRAAELNVKHVAAVLKLDEESVKYTLLTVRDDPYAQFLFNIWR